MSSTPLTMDDVRGMVATYNETSTEDELKQAEDLIICLGKQLAEEKNVAGLEQLMIEARPLYEIIGRAKAAKLVAESSTPLTTDEACDQLKQQLAEALTERDIVRAERDIGNAERYVIMAERDNYRKTCHRIRSERERYREKIDLYCKEMNRANTEKEVYRAECERLVMESGHVPWLTKSTATEKDLPPVEEKITVEEIGNLELVLLSPGFTMPLSIIQKYTYKVQKLTEMFPRGLRAEDTHTVKSIQLSVSSPRAEAENHNAFLRKCRMGDIEINGHWFNRETVEEVLKTLTYTHSHW